MTTELKKMKEPPITGGSFIYRKFFRNGRFFSLENSFASVMEQMNFRQTFGRTGYMTHCFVSTLRKGHTMSIVDAGTWWSCSLMRWLLMYFSIRYISAKSPGRISLQHSPHCQSLAYCDAHILSHIATNRNQESHLYRNYGRYSLNTHKVSEMHVIMSGFSC